MSSLKKLNPLPSQEYLKERLDYDPDTGVFTWKKRPIEHFKNTHAMNIFNSQLAGKQVGNVGDDYIVINISGVIYQASRVAWKIVTGNDPESLIDHKDTIKSNNRFNNLREATHLQNNQNSSIPTNNTSGFKGVCWDKQTKKWRSQIWNSGKNKCLGRFNTPEEAHTAYCIAATKYYGEFARFA